MFELAGARRQATVVRGLTSTRHRHGLGHLCDDGGGQLAARVGEDQANRAEPKRLYTYIEFDPNHPQRCFPLMRVSEGFS